MTVKCAATKRAAGSPATGPSAAEHTGTVLRQACTGPKRSLPKTAGPGGARPPPRPAPPGGWPPTLPPPPSCSRTSGRRSFAASVSLYTDLRRPATVGEPPLAEKSVSRVVGAAARTREEGGGPGREVLAADHHRPPVHLRSAQDEVRRREPDEPAAAFGGSRGGRASSVERRRAGDHTDVPIGAGVGQLHRARVGGERRRPAGRVPAARRARAGVVRRGEAAALLDAGDGGAPVTAGGATAAATVSSTCGTCSTSSSSSGGGGGGGGGGTGTGRHAGRHPASTACALRPFSAAEPVDDGQHGGARAHHLPLHGPHRGNRA
jgi:hypothetical protein